MGKDIDKSVLRPVYQDLAELIGTETIYNCILIFEVCR